MTKVILLVIFLAICGDLMAQKENELVKVSLLYVSSSIETNSAITCEDFGVLFGKKQMKTKTFIDSILLQGIEQGLEVLKYTKKNTTIDVRAKLLCYFKDKPQPVVICLNKFYTMQVNGKAVKSDKKLVSVIKKILPQWWSGN